MIKNLIFDFDGTISDSYPIFVRLVRDVAAEFDVEVDFACGTGIECRGDEDRLGDGRV